jgi:hypothetical protein
MVPMRYIFEELGALVEYDTDTNSINVSYCETPVLVFVSKKDYA